MNPIRICSAFWTASSAVATDTTNLAPAVQNMVDTVGEEVKQTSGILNKIFQPILDKLPSLIFAILFLLIGFFLVKQIMRILKRAFNRSNMDGIMSSFIRSVAKIVLYVLLIVIALSILDVPMDSIVAVIASAGVAVGLALKDSLSNLAGGFIILFSKPLKEGDTIEADGVTGKVEAITILYTRIVTADNKTVFIPNGVVASGKIINYTDKDTRRVDRTSASAMRTILMLPARYCWSRCRRLRRLWQNRKRKWWCSVTTTVLWCCNCRCGPRAKTIGSCTTGCWRT